MQKINYVHRGGEVVRQEGSKNKIVFHIFHEAEMAAIVADILNQEVPRLVDQSYDEGYTDGYGAVLNDLAFKEHHAN